MSATGHCLIVGMTESGKTDLAKRIAAQYRASGVKTVIMDPMHDDTWPADYKTDSIADFMSLVQDPKRCTQCALFIDETGLSLDRYDTSFQWLTCQARHFGHVTHLITQRAEQVDPNVREQCKTLFAFQLPVNDAKKYAASWNTPLVLKASTLKQGWYIKAQRFGETGVFRLPWAER